MIAMMAARDAQLIANQAWQFMLDMKDRYLSVVSIRWSMVSIASIR
jgi:hypothetical protein